MIIKCHYHKNNVNDHKNIVNDHKNIVNDHKNVNKHNHMMSIIIKIMLIIINCR